MGADEGTQVREQNHIHRPLDLLRIHPEKIEPWILEQAGTTFDVKAEPGKLRVVTVQYFVTTNNPCETIKRSYNK